MGSLLDGSSARLPRARALAAALAASLGTCAFLAAPSVARAHVEAVTNCEDSGAGSLRDAVAAAASDDTINFSSLSCGRITLTSGAIAVTQDTLSLQGPGADVLTIDGYYGDRVFKHTGTGMLTLIDVTVARGKYESNVAPVGGCIASAGDVQLISAVVTGCLVRGTGDTIASGGGVYAAGDLSMLGARLTANTVNGASTLLSNAHGGGGVAHGSLYMKYGTVSNNIAYTDINHASGSGGLQAYGYASIESSTISGNYAQFFGGIAIEGVAGGVITNSTISGNSAHRISGVYTQAPLVVSNSTIAFNLSAYGSGALFSQVDIELQSTIISGNETVAGIRADDLAGADGIVVSGANNLIVASAIPVPPDTISACPHLVALDYNGGVTLTHALRSDSPAIEHGNNALALDTDQRGADRVSGASADIGAFEWNNSPGFGFRGGFEPVCDD